MQLRQSIAKADVAILLGSRDDRVADYTAELLKNNVAPICVVTGGIVHRHDMLAAAWGEKTEADHFISKLLAVGINEDRIYREPEATNTGQNATFSHALLHSRNIYPKSILIITKPYMERRALATFEAQWPDKSARLNVSSVGGTIDAYCDETQDMETVINIMVGDLQRIIEYPKRGLSVEQQIPAGIVQAFEALCQVGHVKHLL